MGTVLGYLRPYRWRVAAGVTIKFTAAVLELLIPLLLERIIVFYVPAEDLPGIWRCGGLMALMAEMDRLVKRDSQLIIATHSPILMSFPGSEVLLLGEEGIRSVDYRETSHYQLTRRFLEDPERMFRYLLEG